LLSIAALLPPIKWLHDNSRTNSASQQETWFCGGKLADLLPLEYGDLRLTLFVEIKKNKGDSWTKVIEQAANAAVFAADEDEILATHLIIMRGKEIAFFEYYNYRTYLKDAKVINFEGLIPVTKKVPRGQKELEGLLAITSNLPANQGTTLEFGSPSRYYP
jgi:hypothetical protein